MGEVLAIASVAASAVSAGTAFLGAQASAQAGRAARQQAQQQAQQLADQREQVAMAARAEEAGRLDALQRTLGAAAALRGARGLSMDTAGEGALIDASAREAEREIDTIRLNAEREGRSLGLASQRALLSGNAAVQQANSTTLAGYGRAVTSSLSAGQQGFNYLSKP